MLKNSLSPSDSDSLQFLYFKICYLEEYQNLQVLSNTFLRMCLSSWKRLDFNDHLQMHCIFLTAVELHATNSAKRNTAFTNRNSRDIKAFLTIEKSLGSTFSSQMFLTFRISSSKHKIDKSWSFLPPRTKKKCVKCWQSLMSKSGVS